MDERQLLPIFVAGTLLVVLLLTQWTAGERRRITRTAIVGLFLAHVTIGALAVRTFIMDARQLGLGYNSVEWRGSPLIARVEQIPVGVRIRTNAEDAIYFLTGRMASSLPGKYDPASTLKNAHYGEELRTVGQSVGRGGVVVWFATVPWRRYAPTRDELVALPDLAEVARERDGSLFVSR